MPRVFEGSLLPCATAPARGRPSAGWLCLSLVMIQEKSKLNKPQDLAPANRSQHFLSCRSAATQLGWAQSNVSPLFCPFWRKGAGVSNWPTTIHARSYQNHRVELEIKFLKPWKGFTGAAKQTTPKLVEIRGGIGKKEHHSPVLALPSVPRSSALGQRDAGAEAALTFLRRFTSSSSSLAGL